MCGSCEYLEKKEYKEEILTSKGIVSPLCGVVKLKVSTESLFLSLTNIWSFEPDRGRRTPSIPVPQVGRRIAIAFATSPENRHRTPKINWKKARNSAIIYPVLYNIIQGKNSLFGGN